MVETNAPESPDAQAPSGDDISPKLRNGPIAGPWRQTLVQLATYLENVATLVDLVHEGVRSIGFIPAVREALRGPGTDPEASEEAGRRRADLAQEEIDRDFPLFHAYSLVGVWGALEAAIEDCCAAWLRERPDLLLKPEIARIKISLAVFQGMDDDERISHLVTEIQHGLKSDLKRGVGQFESLLDLLDLGGPVDDDIKLALLEAQQIRHLWAHRAGIADRSFLDRVPTLGIEVGQEVRVGTAEFQRFMAAIQLYLIVVINRFRRAEGLTPAGLPENLTSAVSRSQNDA